MVQHAPRKVRDVTFMAKKKEQEYTYMGVSLPQGEREYETVRWRFGGINRRDRIDTGEFTDMCGISSEADYLTVDPPFDKSTIATKRYARPVQVESFDTFQLVLYVNDGGALMADMIAPNLPATTVTVNENNDIGTDKRSVVLFNVLEMKNGNIATAEFKPTILVFPDKKSFPATPTTGEAMVAADLGSTYPDLTTATSFQGRVFGSDGTRVFASEYNDYAGWNLDTAEESLSSNAWVTTTQTNVRADDIITGVCVYQNHVVVFKRGYMHMIYGTENPFRLVDIGERGAVGLRAFCEVNGILYFASSGGIYAFDGNSVSEMSRNVLTTGKELGGDTVLCGDARYLYVNGVYANGETFALRYDTTYGVWTRQALPNGAVVKDASANNASQHDVSVFCEDGFVYAPSEGAVKDYTWFAETDLMCLSRMDIRRIKKIQIMGVADGSAKVEVYLLRRGEEFTSRCKPVAVRDLTSNEGESVFTLRALIRMFSSVGHRVRIVGKGAVRILGIDMKLSYGGDVYVTE